MEAFVAVAAPRRGGSPTHRLSSARRRRAPPPPPPPRASRGTAGNGGGVPSVVKVCGVSNVHDAELVLEVCSEAAPLLGGSELLLGMILWPRSRRSIAAADAEIVARRCAAAGVRSVAVFVDESAADIVAVQNATGVDYVQLHGERSRSQYRRLPAAVRSIVSVDVAEDGSWSLAANGGDGRLRDGDFWLFDSRGGGSGRRFDWSRFAPPAAQGAAPWLLAGGLHAGNVAEAVSALRPFGVDVAGGVAGDDGVRKDRRRLADFLAAALRPPPPPPK